jgi:hypothetical protein
MNIEKLNVSKPFENPAQIYNTQVFRENMLQNEVVCIFSLFDDYQKP